MADDKERIAKVIARAGLASRREAEAMILAGRVVLNGTKLDTPAMTVGADDKIVVDGKPLPQAASTRLWRYHKPKGLVTTTSDEKGRKTIFDALPEDLPRLMTVGRLDLNSEGLLLLTNDGGLKRKLELPATGWLRRYRVRVFGKPSENALDKLRAGIEVDGERFRGMDVKLDKSEGSNAWLTVGLREGKNREVRRAFSAVGYDVNRLLRVSYGPFQLGDLPRGEVELVPGKIMRDQLGGLMEGAMVPTRSKAAATKGPRPTGTKKPNIGPACGAKHLDRPAHVKGRCHQQPVAIGDRAQGQRKPGVFIRIVRAAFKDHPILRKAHGG